MNGDVLFSSQSPPIGWADATSLKPLYGPKGAYLATVPRLWTLPFVLIPSNLFVHKKNRSQSLRTLGDGFFEQIKKFSRSGRLLVRSSVIGESIWDRGKYDSVVIDTEGKDLAAVLCNASDQVIRSAGDKPSGLVVQNYVEPRSRGEFGNLLRISKTRDHWELSITASDGTTAKSRFNTQRDESANTERQLQIKPGRAFGSIAAWLNNQLVRGYSIRLSCEWITDGRLIYLVQIDEEDEDTIGCNPFQFLVRPICKPSSRSGHYLAAAEGDALEQWDKLKVLDELWEPDASHRPMLFFTVASRLTGRKRNEIADQLEQDFQSIIGPNDIVVRTSARAGKKVLNLPRTECVGPSEAASWCLDKLSELRQLGKLKDFAFVAHRFVAARASAWVRAEPGNAIVEIHALWGLPDALQYCPYDRWDVHTVTEVATDYPDYKSNILVPQEGGGWEYVRIKNELARSLCIGQRDAIDLARRTARIVENLGKACHVMWFVGCKDEQGNQFSMPWYWTEAFEKEKNTDRSNYAVIEISDYESLKKFKKWTGPNYRHAVELRPTDQELMRDTKFIDEVASAAIKVGFPVILSGSTLAHAYYQFTRSGCTVIARGEKNRTRVRHSMEFGKLVRDKIPDRIVQRQEAEITRKVPNELLKGFLVGKLLEEAMEIRSSKNADQKLSELADLYEVFRALARSENVSLNRIADTAKNKRMKAGGFEDGFVLLQTGLLGSGRLSMRRHKQPILGSLGRKVSESSYELPFTFFGFMELHQPRSVVFDDLGISLTLELKEDRVIVTLSKDLEQLELSLDVQIEASDDRDN